VSKPRPRPQARALAAGLRDARAKAALPMQWVADQLGWSQSTISRMEAGKRPVTPEEVATLLATYRVTGEARDRLIAMARDASRPSWLETLRHEGLPQQSVMLAQYEAEATRLVYFDLLVTGLLQTRAYTNAVMRAGVVAPSDIEPRVNLRMQRQRVLDGPNAPRLLSILDEAALRRMMGGPRVMIEQLEHLMEMSERPNVELRVIPFDHGGHAGVTTSFGLLEFGAANPLVHIEHSGASGILDQPDHVHPFVDRVASMQAVALEPEASVRFVSDVAAEYRGR